MTRILDRYIATHIIGATLLVALLLVALSAFLLLLGQLDNLDGDYRLGDAFRFVALSTPQQLYELLPMAVLLGALIGLGQLASSNELMVMRAAGISVFRLGRSAMVGGLVIAMLAFVIGEFVAPPAEQYARATRNFARLQRVSLLGTSGVWARDGSRFVNVRGMVREDELRNVSVFEFDADRELKSVLVAREAGVSENGWQLSNISVTEFKDGEVSTRRVRRMAWDTLLSPSLLRLFVV